MDISYTNWRPGEPNNDPCGEPYVQIIRGCSFGYNTWNNLGDNSSNGSCYSNMVPIMEIDPALYQPNSGSGIELIWSTGETAKSISVNPTETTEYWVDVLINGQIVCREYFTVTVEEPIELPALDTFICLPSGQPISEIPTNGAVMNWYDSPEFGFLLAGSYVPTNDQTLYGSAVNPLSGCESPDRIAVEINLIDAELEYNNLITVDGNDSNNALKISEVERFPENRMEIYNRYGNLVWTIEGYDNLNKVFEGEANVDGVFSKGSFLPSGTYFFLLRYSNACTNSELKGFFQLDNRM
jgi:gliding motility-associated-like protein